MQQDDDGVRGQAASGDELLEAFAAGDESATRLAEAGLGELLPQVYDELRGMAANYLHHERAGHTLQPTALVHEAFLRMAEGRVDVRDRAHFLAVAARMMRRILVTQATAKKAQKRGGGAPEVLLDEALHVFEQRSVSTIEVNRALTELEERDQRQAHITELRFFGGLSVEETAEVLGISPATVKREWSVAKLWLKRAMAGT